MKKIVDVTTEHFVFRLMEVGRVVPLQNRTRNNSYPKFGTPVSYPLLQDVCQVVPATGRTLKLVPYFNIIININTLIFSRYNLFGK